MRLRDAVSVVAAFSEAVSGHVVNSDQVRQRTAVCSACPMRKRTQGISKASEVLGLVANKHRVPVEVAAYSCDVCGCSLMMLLPAKTESLHKDTPDEAAKRPAGCWIKQESKA